MANKVNWIFIQEDPQWAVNLYAYVGSNPLNATDPSGLVSITWRDVILAWLFTALSHLMGRTNVTFWDFFLISRAPTTTLPLTESYAITGKFGEKRPTHIHGGADFAPYGKNKYNTPAVAAETAIVAETGKSKSRGNYVILGVLGADIELHYYHLKNSPIVTKGQIVEKGEELGIVGSTGRSTGVHLHFETHIRGTPINPVYYLGF